MKTLFLGLATFALLAFAGCNDSKTTSGATTQKSAQDGSGKCDGAKKVEKKAQCGTGKCGNAK